MTRNTDSRPIVLVVEDEFVIAMDLSDAVQGLGYDLEGPFPDKANAFEAIGKALPDAAILDVNILDGDVFPLADALALQGVPIIFHSGHLAEDQVGLRYPQAIACTKPCPPDRLMAVLRQVVGR